MICSKGIQKKKMCCMTKKIVDWSNLPEPILEMISEKSDLCEFVCMVDVCKNWSRILTQLACHQKRRGFPWLVMSGQSDTTIRSCFSVLENKLWLKEMPKSFGGHFMGSFQEWLIMVKCESEDPLSFSSQISLMNPFLNIEIILPEVSSSYHKLLFSKYPGDKNCAYMLLPTSSTGLTFWTPEARKWRHFKVAEFEVSRLVTFVDGICFNDCFYLLDSNNNIRVIDVTDLPSTIKKESEIEIDLSSRTKRKSVTHSEFYQVRMSHDIPVSNSKRLRLSKYLVEFCGEIILVYRFLKREHDDHHNCSCFETYDFKIYKLDLSKMAWVELDSLGDYVLFVCKTGSRYFSAKELGFGMTNCIYFTSEYEDPFNTEWEPASDLVSILLYGVRNELKLYDRKGSKTSDWGVFNLSKDCSNRFSHCTKNKLKTWPPTWVTAPLWWYLSFQKNSSS